MAIETGKTINMISSQSFQNTWRNWVSAIGVCCIIIVSTLYVYHREFYIPITISENQSSTLALTAPAPQVKGIKEYHPYRIGGDVVSDIRVPEKSDMFIPFDVQNLSATGMLVKDMTTGQVLFGHNEYTVHSLASVTKLMSALVLQELVVDWNRVTTSSPDTIYDSHVFSGESATLEHWFEVALVGSSNRAILTLVDGSGHSREEFIARMNQKAKELGMSETEFTDPTGIDPGNVSTPSDVALLLTEALNTPHIVTTISLHSVDHDNGKKISTIWSTNWLLTGWVKNDFTEPVIGKTGYIVESNYNFVGKFSKDTDRNILVVVLGSENDESRFTDALQLANWAFTNYDWVKP